MQRAEHHAIPFQPAAAGPLAGVRVLDLSRLVAGNMLSLQLADFGADVIKVEPPAGDPLRDWRDARQRAALEGLRAATSARSCSTCATPRRRPRCCGWSRPPTS